MTKQANFHNFRDPKTGRFAKKSNGTSSSPNITPVPSPTPQSPRPKRAKYKIQPALVNNVCFCIDGSGSMQDIKHDVVKTVNQWLGTLQDKANSENQKTYVSMLRFSSTVKPFMNNVEVNDVRQVSVSDTYDGNMTALRDAVMEGRGMLNRGQSFYKTLHSNVASLLILITDGQENVSRTSPREFSRAIQEMLASGTYTIVCLVPNRYSMDWLVSLGVPASNIEIWENTKAGVEQIGQSVTSGLGGYYACRSTGQSSMMGFFGQ